MVLDTKNTTVAYRCPVCGGAVMSGINLFALSADMLRLKCTCGGSDMTIVREQGCNDGANAAKITLTVPCLICPKPHTFTMSKTLFFGRDLFTVSCPYSDITLCCVGEENAVKAEMARSEYELIKLLEENGIEDIATLRKSLIGEDKPDEQSFPTDPQIRDIVLFVLKEMDEEGKIYCHCPQDGEKRDFDVNIVTDGLWVKCRCCGASRWIPTDSGLAAHDFLNADSLDLTIE